MRGLSDKRVLITGGAGGIGSTTAARFLEEGSQVIIMDQDQDACQIIEQQFPSLEKSIICDVSSPDSVNQAFKQLMEQLGGVDVLINNAGISIRHRFVDITPEEWKRVSHYQYGIHKWISRVPLLW
jgi:NAD(P)-dependent dehydrogenase (short-subunit alcohol dehydrogenase family)